MIRVLAIAVAITSVVIAATFIARAASLASPQRPTDAKVLLVPAGAPIPLLEESYGDSDMTPYAVAPPGGVIVQPGTVRDRKSTRLNSSHANISYAVFCLKKKNINQPSQQHKEYMKTRFSEHAVQRWRMRR